MGCVSTTNTKYDSKSQSSDAETAASSKTSRSSLFESMDSRQIFKNFVESSHSKQGLRRTQSADEQVYSTKDASTYLADDVEISSPPEKNGGMCEIPDSENKMVRISLFGRYQGSDDEDEIIQSNWSSLNLPEDLKIRWLKSVDFKNGYSNLTNLEPTSAPNKHFLATALPNDVIIDADDSLHFKKEFRRLFPDRKEQLKILAVTNADGKVVATGVLFIQTQKSDDSTLQNLSSEKEGIIGDIRIDKEFKYLDLQNTCITDQHLTLSNSMTTILKALAIANHCKNLN